MGFFALFVLAVGLSMDAFAVSVCKGLSMKKAGVKGMLVCGGWFGCFQALMPLIGFLLGSLFAGSFSAVLFSLAGGAVSWAVMSALKGLFPEKLLWVVSVFGAIGHNAGQLLAAVAVTGTPGLFWYGPALLAAAIVTGAFTGVGAMYLVRALRAYEEKRG